MSQDRHPRFFVSWKMSGIFYETKKAAGSCFPLRRVIRLLPGTAAPANRDAQGQEVHPAAFYQGEEAY